MEITDLSGEMSIDASATGSLEGSYSMSMSVTGTEDSGGSSFMPPIDGGGLSGLGASIRAQVETNLAGALANLPSLPGL